MQKAAFIILPVAALVVLALVFSRLARREAADKERAASNQGAPAGSATSAEFARLQKQVEALAKDVEAQRKRAEAAEAKLAEAGSESAAGTAKESAKSAAKKADWKTRRDSELEAKVKSMDWRRNVKGVIAYWKELEAARMEGRAPQFSPELMGPLNALQADMSELAKFLGIEGGNTYDVFKNGLVGEAWQDGFFQEMSGGALTEGQLAKLRTTSLYESDEDWEFGAGNILEKWTKLIERNRNYGTETAGILTQEQHALVARTVTPTYMLSLYSGYSERTMTGTGPEVTQSVANFWLKSFNLPEEQRAVVEAAAAEYVRRQAEIAQAVSTQHGGLKSRDAEYDLLIKTIEAQLAMEKKLSETLPLDPEQAKKLLKGSGAVIKIPY